MASVKPAVKQDQRLDHLQSLLQELEHDSSSNEALRKELSGILQDYAPRVEPPGDAIWRFMLLPHQCAALRSVVAMRIPHILAEGEEPLTAEELTRRTGAEKLLIGTNTYL